MQLRRRQLLMASPVLAAALGGLPVWAQQQVLRLVVGFPPGGTGDVFGRALAEQLRQELNMSVLVDNKEGAGGLIAGETFKNSAPPDGSQILMHTASSAVFALVVRKKPPYEPKDFQWIAQVSVAPLVVVANPQLPVQNVKMFVDYLRANPGQPYGSAGIGASTHLAAELFLDLAGAKALHVPYKGSAPSIIDTIAGRVNFMLETLATTQQHHAAGKMKIVCVLAPERMAAAPDIPTAREFGIDAVASTYNLICAPLAAPKERVDVLARAISNVMKKPDFQKTLRAQGLEPVSDSNPERARAFVASEFARWAPIAKRLNIEV